MNSIEEVQDKKSQTSFRVSMQATILASRYTLDLDEAVAYVNSVEEQPIPTDYPKDFATSVRIARLTIQHKIDDRNLERCLEDLLEKVKNEFLTAVDQGMVTTDIAKFTGRSSAYVLKAAKKLGIEGEWRKTTKGQRTKYYKASDALSIIEKL